MERQAPAAAPASPVSAPGNSNREPMPSFADTLRRCHSDGARAYEELGSRSLGLGAPFHRRGRAICVLSAESARRASRMSLFAHRLPPWPTSSRRGALGEPGPGADAGELARAPHGAARAHRASAFPSQPFAVEQMRARAEVHPMAAAEACSRLAVERRPRLRRRSSSARRAGRCRAPRRCRSHWWSPEPPSRPAARVGVPLPAARLDELGAPPLGRRRDPRCGQVASAARGHPRSGPARCTAAPSPVDQARWPDPATGSGVLGGPPRASRSARARSSPGASARAA